MVGLWLMVGLRFMIGFMVGHMVGLWLMVGLRFMIGFMLLVRLLVGLLVGRFHIRCYRGHLDHLMGLLHIRFCCYWWPKVWLLIVVGRLWWAVGWFWMVWFRLRMVWFWTICWYWMVWFWTICWFWMVWFWLICRFWLVWLGVGRPKVRNKAERFSL